MLIRVLGERELRCKNKSNELRVNAEGPSDTELRCLRPGPNGFGYKDSSK